MDDDGKESEDSEVNWQIVSSSRLKKRLLNDSPKIFKHKNKKPKNNNLNNNLCEKNTSSANNKNNVKSTRNNNNGVMQINYEASTSKQATVSANKTTTNPTNNDKESQNQFSDLSEDDDDDDMNDNDNNNDEAHDTDNEETTETNLPKPPPIIIPNVSNISAMIKSFSNIICPTEFNYKTLKDGQVRVMVKNIQTYRMLVTYLNDKKLNFHTYQVRQERSYRVVMKNLHHTTPTQDIKSAIESLGHQVRNVTNIRSKISRAPLPMFFIDLEPNVTNKNIYDITRINNAIVSIVPPKKTNDLVQCHRCQEFGHTKSYCKKSVSCVKCGLGHLTVECSKPTDTPARCVNCLKNHPANYKGCEIYKQILKKKLQNSNFRTRNVRYAPNADFPTTTNNNNAQFNQYSYADALRTPQQSSDNPFEKIEVLLQNQIELTNKLLTMMSALIAKLCN